RAWVLVEAGARRAWRWTVLKESTEGAVAAGTLALLEAAGPSDPRLAVEVEGVGGDPAVAAAGTTIRAVVDRAGFGRPAEAGPGKASDLRAYVLSPRTAVGPDDPVPQLGPLGQPTLTVVGRDGRLAMPV